MKLHVSQLGLISTQPQEHHLLSSRSWPAIHRMEMRRRNRVVVGSSDARTRPVSVCWIKLALKEASHDLTDIISDIVKVDIL